jgi:hypothetical protein
MAKPLNAGFTYYLHFVQASVAAWGISHANKDRMFDAVLRLTGCKEVCDAHQAWARFEVQAHTWEGMQSEVTAMRGKVERILSRYTRGAVTQLDE